MKRYSLTDPLPDSYPMTPPDEPPEADMSRAKDCLCGGDSLHIVPEGFPGYDDGSYYVRCGKCHKHGPVRADIGDAIDAWNEWIIL